MASQQKNQHFDNEYSLEKQERYQEHDQDKKKNLSKQRENKQKQKWG